MKYCATTVALPQFDMRETAELLSRLGFDGAEWRVRRIPEERKGEAYSPWGNHKNDLSLWRSVLTAITAYTEVDVVQRSSYPGQKDNEQDRIESFYQLVAGILRCALWAEGSPASLVRDSAPREGKNTANLCLDQRART